MGRKKKKASKPWCWYCNEEFNDEKFLIKHQMSNHFKCSSCLKKLCTGPDLAIHCLQVHKNTLEKVPNALPNRNKVDIEIYGMEGIPAEDVREHETQKHGSRESTSSKIMHPDEDISLEEKRAQLPRYQVFMRVNAMPMILGFNPILMNSMPMTRPGIRMPTGMPAAMTWMNPPFAGQTVYSQGPSLLPHMMGQAAPRPF